MIHRQSNAVTPRHLFILSGQSNMARLDATVSFQPAVEAAFGREQVVIAKQAKGGQPIRCWVRGWKAADGSVPETGAHAELYEALLDEIRRVAAGQAFSTVTFLWMQGERDANERHGAVYRESFLNLLAQLRDDLDWPALHVVIGRLSDFDLSNERYPHWTWIREIQMQLAEELPSARWVNTDDLNDGVNEKGEPIANDLHYSVDGYAEFGRRLAGAAIALIRAGQPAD